MPALHRKEPREYERVFLYLGKDPDIIPKLDELSKYYGLVGNRSGTVRMLIKQVHTILFGGPKHVEGEG